MEYNIGDVVTIKQSSTMTYRSYGDLTAWMSRKSSLTGKTAVIADKMFSEAESKYLYRVRMDGEKNIRSSFFTDEDFVGENEDEYTLDAKVLDNVCVVIVFRNENGEKVEVSRGHGHRIHEGELGIMQAFSYAIKKAYEKINNGNI